MNEFLNVHVQAAAQRGGAFLEKNPAVAHVAAGAAALDGSALAVERKLDARARRLAQQAGKQSGVAPLGRDQVGIVGAQQTLEAAGDGLVAIVEHLRLIVVHRHFQRAAPAVLGIHARQAFEARAHHAQRRQLVIYRPLVVAALDGADFESRDPGLGICN
jgi:hypothetical protein